MVVITSQDYADRILQSLGLDPKSFHQTSFTFSQKSAPKTWTAFTSGAFFPVYRIKALGAKVSDIKSFISGIQSDNFVIVVELDEFNVLCLSRHKKGEPPYVLPLRREEDYDKVVSVLRKHDFTSDELTAHVAIDTSIELLKSGAERDFVNRGLFSSYFLRERLEKALSERKREVWKESKSFFSHFGGPAGIPTDFESIPTVLHDLGYSIRSNESDGDSNTVARQFVLSHGSIALQNATVVASPAENLDIMPSNDRAVPSVQAVSALDQYPWVILTNGRLWRLYSARVSSASTNYFEVDLEGVADEKDPKLKYFVGLFSAAALSPRQDITDVDFVFDGGVQYGKELEDDLRKKVFEQQLFLDLVRAVIQHSPEKKYSEVVLAEAKKKALKLLYRLLFVLYAESRNLLPAGDSRYEQISLGKVRERLAAMEKELEGRSTWNALQRLFNAISNGDPNVNVPEYDGALFEEDKSIDDLEIMNKHLVPALRALTEKDGKGIDYQNLGVRQLGSLYEALLEYTVSQAETDLVVIKDEILDMSFTSELNKKPARIIEKGDIFLSAGGLARKGTGSYYTPDKIVKFLVRKGLEPIFEDREKKFTEQVTIWKERGSREAAQKSIDILLDIQVVDPAMGSGHFLVTVVDEISRWIMGILKRHPDAPLAREIGKDREQIIEEQKKKGIKLDKDLLTFNVILKRRVMKRCVFGVDINPLAVELAKLSLWLDSFTIGTPLTFLDHHIRAGDSLIGLWMDNLKARKPDNTTLDAWTGNVESIGDLLQQVSYPADLTINEVKKSRNNYEEFRERSHPLHVLLDMQAAGIIDEELHKQLPRNLSLVEETIRNGKLDGVIWAEPVKKVQEYRNKYGFFHWELEFPDAFTDSRRGFDLIVMNPPWHAVRLYDDDFFSQYYPSFRMMSTKLEKEKLMSKILKDKAIAKSYREYAEIIQSKLIFFKQSQQYIKRGGGGIAFDYWALFLERAMNLLSKDGTLSIILPFGVLGNEGASVVRKSMLQKRIRGLFEFENAEGIFPDVDRRYKFVLLIIDNKESTGNFPAAFYLQDIAALDEEKEKERFVTITNDFVRLVSPETNSIPEVANSQDITICTKIYHRNPLFANGIRKSWEFTILRELHKTESAGLFRTDGKGWPLIEGKHFHQFLADYEKPEFTVRPEEGLRKTAKIRELHTLNHNFHDVPRIVFRAVASSTNVRSMIACILPKNVFTTHSVFIVLPRLLGQLSLDKNYFEIIAYLAAILNSTVFDFLIRLRVTMNISFFHVYQTPIPADFDNATGKQIIAIAARLSSIDKRFDEFAKSLNVPFGPLTVKDRLDLTARLDALVAYHYGLNRQEYEHILNTFYGFVEDQNLQNISDVIWDDSLIKRLNGEVRKRALSVYDSLPMVEQKEEG